MQTNIFLSLTNVGPCGWEKLLSLKTIFRLVFKIRVSSYCCGRFYRNRRILYSFLQCQFKPDCDTSGSGVMFLVTLASQSVWGWATLFAKPEKDSSHWEFANLPSVQPDYRQGSVFSPGLMAKDNPKGNSCVAERVDFSCLRPCWGCKVKNI